MNVEVFPGVFALYSSQSKKVPSSPVVNDSFSFSWEGGDEKFFPILH